MSSNSPHGRLLLDHPSPDVARLTISNPHKRGALDHSILDAFATTLPELDARCVIVTGEQNTFSAGYDIGDLPEAVLAQEAQRLVANPVEPAIDAIESYPYPTLRPSTVTPSAADWRSRWPATCGSRPRRSRSRCRPPSLGWSTPTPGFASSST